MKVTFGLKKNPEVRKSGQLKQKWDFNTESTLLAPPIIYEHKKEGRKSIVFGTKEGKIYSLDKDSKVNWIFDAEESTDDLELMFLDVDTANSIQSPPNIHDLTGDGNKEIVFGSERGAIYAINHEGKQIWKYMSEGSVRGGVIIKDIDMDGKPEVIFGSGDKHLYILTHDGKLKKKIEIGSGIESTPEIIGTKILIGTNEGELHCLKSNGETDWVFKTEGKIAAQASVGKIKGTEEELIVVGSTDHYMYMLNQDGEMIWKYKTNGAIYSKAALADINRDKKLEIIFGSCDNKVYALDHKGDHIWSYETDFWVVAPVIVTDLDDDGKLEIVAGSYDHNLYILDAKGNYIMDYIPGLAGVMQQTGSYTDVITSEPGKTVGKKIWQYQTEGVVVGCAMIPDSGEIVVNTKPGKIKNLGLEKG